MKCCEIFKTKAEAKEFFIKLMNEGYDMNEVEFDETYEPNDDIPYEEYEKHIEDYRCWVVWFNPKPLVK